MPDRRPLPQPTEQPVRAERFRAALQPRVLGLAGLGGGDNFRAVLLERGEAMLRSPETEHPLAAPLAGWFPWQADMRLHLGAGAQGAHLLLGPQTLDRALRQRPEAAHLRFMADRTALLRLAGAPEPSRVMAACFDGILAETLTPGAMSAGVVESLLHVLLVQFYRGQAAAPGPRDERGGTAAIASRFVTLVETHFRTHRTVARYAQALGISRDRLTDVCRAVHGRPPGALIRARLALEARLYLDTSPLGLDQIAALLGFASAPQFNRFFKDQVGMPPGRYRTERSQDEAGHADTPAEPFAWP